MKTVIGDQPGRGRSGLRVQRPFPEAETRRPEARHERQHREGREAAEALAAACRRDRPGCGQGQLRRRLAALCRKGQHADEGRGHARSRDHRRTVERHPAGVGAAPRPDQAGRLFQQRPRAVLFGTDQLQAGVGHGRVHAEPGVRRCAAAARRAQDADLARCAGALHQRRALRARLGPRRPDVLGAGQGVDEVRAAPGDAGCDGHRRPRARAGRLRRRGARRQDDHHVDRQRRAHRAIQEEGCQHGGRRRARCCSTTC